MSNSRATGSRSAVDYCVPHRYNCVPLKSTTRTNITCKYRTNAEALTNLDISQDEGSSKRQE
jgi:hypothetical protein